jgi:hypothetical protein
MRPSRTQLPDKTPSLPFFARELNEIGAPRLGMLAGWCQHRVHVMLQLTPIDVIKGKVVSML